MKKQFRCGRPEISEAVKFFKFLGGKTIVEIGSIRQTYDWMGDGHSTLVWAAVAQEVFSVDINPEATELTRKLTEGFGTVSAINEDGLSFLGRFDQPIDLLYLDGWDTDLPECSERHLEAYRLASKNLHEKSIILIDDTGIIDDQGVHPNPGKGSKGELLIPEAIRDGWAIGLQLYQTLLARPEVIRSFMANYPG